MPDLVGSDKKDGDPRAILDSAPRALSHLTAPTPYLWNG